MRQNTLVYDGGLSVGAGLKGTESRHKSLLMAISNDIASSAITKAGNMPTFTSIRRNDSSSSSFDLDNSSHSRKEEDVPTVAVNDKPSVTFPEWRPRPPKPPPLYATPPYVPRTTWSPFMLLNTLFKRPERVHIEITSDEEAALRKEQEANFRRHPTSSLPILPMHGNKSGVIVQMSEVVGSSEHSLKATKARAVLVDSQLEISDSVDEELFL